MTSGSASAADAAAGGPTPVSLYVHVPFCVSKCAYCDFYSTSEAGSTALFVDKVLEAVERLAPVALSDVPTVYFGGGTPTLLGDELVRLVSGVRERAHLRADAEVTVEANPETTDPALVARLLAGGVNRFSLGVQSFDDVVLGTLGRAHDAARAAEACATLSRAGVPFSIDLMCGIPGQSLESWSETLERAAATGALHCSVYPLSIEEGTPLDAAVERGEVRGTDPDEAAEMMEMASRSMGSHAMDRYEVANYARPGHESRHNTGYWTGRPYVGIGPSAASMLPARLARTLEPSSVWRPLLDGVADDSRVRFTMNGTLVEFMYSGWDRMPAQHEVLTAREAAREDVMLGMRLKAGVAARQAEAAGTTASLARLEADGLVELVGDRWRATDRGWLLGNEVFAAVWDCAE